MTYNALIGCCMQLLATVKNLQLDQNSASVQFSCVATSLQPRRSTCGVLRRVCNDLRRLQQSATRSCRRVACIKHFSSCNAQLSSVQFSCSTCSTASLVASCCDLVAYIFLRSNDVEKAPKQQIVNNSHAK